MNEPLNNCITMALMRALIIREQAMSSGFADKISYAYRDSIAIERVANTLRRLKESSNANV
jgi:hypothetical protein